MIDVIPIRELRLESGVIQDLGRQEFFLVVQVARFRLTRVQCQL